MTREEKIEVIRLARESLARDARKDFQAFAALRQPIEQQPALHHRLICEALNALECGEIKGNRLMIFMPPGSAKALTLDTPIPTPSGWSTMGALAIGDEVFDERGVVCRVTWKSPVWRDRPIYSVQTDCGDVIRADKDHEWLVRLCGKPRKAPSGSGRGRQPLANRDDPMSQHKIKETWELHRSRAKRPMILRAGPLDLPEAELPVDPYLLGVWLGDGNSAGMRITSSVEDQPWLRAELGRLGYETRDSSVATLFGVSGVRGKFVAMGLVNDPAHNTHGRKHIPEVFMRGSIAQRLALLQGLVDTDGTVCKRKGSTTFCNTNQELALQFRELVRSLGVKAGWSESRAMLNGKDCGPVYRVSFYLQGSARMPRKADLTRVQHRTPNTYIDVNPCGMADTVCIEVDSKSHLFLCGKSMTPTHNSTYGSVLFPQYFLGRNPALSVIMASHTGELAEAFGRKVRNGIADPEFTAIFPAVGVSSDNAAAGRWSTNHGGEYLSAGVGGSITGRRADLGIIDDPVASREDADSERVRQKTWDWYVNDFLTRLKPGAKQVLCMTRWHEADLAGMLLDRESAKWTILKLPMLAGENDILGRAPGERLWKEWFTDEMIETAQKDARSWIALYQQEPRPIEGAEFKRSWINRYSNPPKILNKIIIVDPAGDPAKATGKKKKSDFTAMGVIGLASDQNAYLIDGLRDKLNLTQRADALFELHKKHKPMQVRYEQYGLQADVEHIKSQMETRQYRFSIKEVGGGVEKNARIRRLVPWFEGGRFWLPHEMTRTNVLGERYDVVKDFIEQEYAGFPVARWDDFFDMLARMCEPSLTLPWPEEDEMSDPKMAHTWGTLDQVTNY